MFILPLVDKMSVNWHFYLLYIQGGWENDETVKEAAVREAIEEAGVRGDIVVRSL